MFFLRNYSGYKAEFAMFYSMIVLFGGFTSGVAGGIICDKFGKGKPMMKAWVACIGNLIAMPMFAIGVLTTNNFYISIGLMLGKYLFGEPWKSPSITMMQNTVEPKKFGNIVSAYQFFYIMSGCLSTIAFGGIANYFSFASDPVAIGKLLAIFNIVAYTGASVAFYMAGRNYTSVTRKTKFTLWPSKNPEPLAI